MSAIDDPDTDGGIDPRDSVEAYRDDGDVVLYDARNPMAWVQSTSAVAVEQCR